MNTRTVTAAAPSRAEVLTKAVLKAADILGLNQMALARVLGVSASTVTRMRASQYQLEKNSKGWELATLLVRLYRGLDVIMASDETALRAWMQGPNTDLHAAPAALIANITGLVQTVAYVDAHRARV